MTLTEEVLRAEAGVTADELGRMVAAGIVRPDADGHFAWHDVNRVRMVQSYVKAGIGLERIEDILRRGLMTFDYIDRYFIEPGGLSGRDYAEFRASLGESGRQLGRLYETLGLPEPSASRPMRADEEQVIREFVQIWAGIGDAEITDRAARLLGDHLRRIVDGWLALWVERMTSQTDVRMVSRASGGDATAQANFERTLDLSHRLSSLLPSALVWLEQRLLEQQLNATNAELFERGLAELGLGPAPPDDPPAIAFVDLAGFTRLTEQQGDEAAVRYGGMLRDAAKAAADRHHGRLVKLLGDGAMLYFPSADSAVDACVELLEPDHWPADLPPARAGIHAGAVIERDGDYFGRTVNLAARLAAYAREGTVVVSVETVSAVTGERFEFEPVGPVTLRNVSVPVEVFEARRRNG